MNPSQPAFTMSYQPDYNTIFYSQQPSSQPQRKLSQEHKHLHLKTNSTGTRGLSNSPERKNSPLLNLEAASWRPVQYNENPSPGVMMNQFFEGNSTDVTHSSIHTESMNNHQGQPVQLCEHLDLINFKLKPCTKNCQHNHKHCPFYHNNKDRKRSGYFYSSDMCENTERGEMCLLGDICTKSHNRVEQLYRPEKYKTKFCSFYPHNISNCEYGAFCSFAHTEAEINIDLIHNLEFDEDFYIFYFKTVWCPFNLAHHDRSLCVYAHNWQDYRRKPQQVCYENVPCPKWKSTDFIGNYDDGCPEGSNCQKCHGWKENEYHPLNYKTKLCPTGRNCQKGSDCPHFHANKDKRFTIFFF